MHAHEPDEPSLRTCHTLAHMHGQNGHAHACGVPLHRQACNCKQSQAPPQSRISTCPAREQRQVMWGSHPLKTRTARPSPRQEQVALPYRVRRGLGSGEVRVQCARGTPHVDSDTRPPASSVQRSEGSCSDLDLAGRPRRVPSRRLLLPLQQQRHLPVQAPLLPLLPLVLLRHRPARREGSSGTCACICTCLGRRV